MKFKVTFEEGNAVFVEKLTGSDSDCALKLREDRSSVDYCIVECDTETQAVETAKNIVHLLWEKSVV